MPNIGEKRVSTHYLTVGEAAAMGFAGLSAVAVTAELVTFLGYEFSTSFFGTSTCSLIATGIISKLDKSGGKFKFVVTEKYMSTKVFDTDTWVEMTDWVCIDIKVSYVA